MSRLQVLALVLSVAVVSYLYGKYTASQDAATLEQLSLLRGMQDLNEEMRMMDEKLNHLEHDEEEEVEILQGVVDLDEFQSALLDGAEEEEEEYRPAFSSSAEIKALNAIQEQLSDLELGGVRRLARKAAPTVQVTKAPKAAKAAKPPKVPKASKISGKGGKGKGAKSLGLIRRLEKNIDEYNSPSAALSPPEDSYRFSILTSVQESLNELVYGGDERKLRRKGGGSAPTVQVTKSPKAAKPPKVPKASKISGKGKGAKGLGMGKDAKSLGMNRRLETEAAFKDPETTPDTVVVFSGPTDLTEGEDNKNSLYKKNFEFFLENGVDCENQDTVLVLTKPVADYFQPIIAHIQSSCTRPDALRILYREDKCYDMESLRVALDELKNLEAYEYFVYINCGVVGPKFDKETSDYNKWTEVYTSMLDESVKMSGLSINCDIHPHVQSMLFATDKVGLQVIQNSEAVYDCGKTNLGLIGSDLQMEIIMRYEVGMGRAIFEAGYGLRSIVSGSGGPLEIHSSDLDDETNSELIEWCNDVWYPEVLPITDTEAPWSGYTFYKSSRMFILSDMQEDIQYENIEDFQVIDAPKFSVALSEEKESEEHDFHQLWVGDVDEPEDMSHLAGKTTSLVVSHCSKGLDWMPEYIKGHTVKSITVISKCGQPPAPEDLPEGALIVELKNIGRIDHTMAYALARTTSDSSDFLVFLKDNQDIHQASAPRTMPEMLNIAAEDGFGCFQEPAFGYSQYHVTQYLKEYSMKRYDGVPQINAETGEEVVNDSFEFKSEFANLADFWEAMGIHITAPLVPVCYGGSYAVRQDHIASVDPIVWHNLEEILSRGDNIEEGHFVERTWAALFTEPLTSREAEMLLEQSDSIGRVLAPDGGGILGALVQNEAQ